MTNDEIARAWRAEVETTLPWRRSADQSGAGGGILGGYSVDAAGFDRRGYLKPGRPLSPEERAKCYAAREKIAADLAVDLRLPIPPATLCRVRGGWDDVEPLGVVTLFMHPLQLDWTDVVFDGRRPPNTTEADVARVVADASGVLAADTWLDQYDHGDGHPGNIVWGYNPTDGRSQVMFLDYASSMGSDGSWANEGWKSVEVAPFPRFVLENLDNEMVERTLNMIQAVPESTIEQIVDRVPFDFLGASEKSVLKAALIGRRELVAKSVRERVLTRGRGV